MFDAAVEKAYGGKRKVRWFEVLAGEKAFNRTGEWLPEDTLTAFREYLVGIKGPLTTPIGGGIRSLNVALRQGLDLYVCLRPVRYIPGVPSPVKRPELVDMVIFRENTEDIYAGIEWAAGTPEVKRVVDFLVKDMGVRKIRFPGTTAIGIKTISREGSERLVEAAIRYALRHGRKSVTLVHKGNIMKFTEGGFKDWGYGVAARMFRDETVSMRESWVLGNRERDPGMSLQDNARALEPGFDRMTPGQKADILREVEAALALLADPRRREVEEEAADQGRDRGHRHAADDHPRGRVRRHRHPEPQRRLPVRHARGPGRGDRHRPRREHQLPHRARDLRGDPRDGAQVREPRQGEPLLRHPFRGS